MTRLFDAYIIVDWSASSTPKTGSNSIWIATRARRKAGGPYETQAENLPTRKAAKDFIYNAVQQRIAEGDRVLVGFDFAMGYPSGTAQKLGLDLKDRPAWLAIYDWLSEAIEDAGDNSNNRFACASRMNAAMTDGVHPFWGTTKRAATEYLSLKKGDFSEPGSLPEHRLSEAWIKAHFDARPKSVWQLMGAGSVGSQSLLGIPIVSALRAQIEGAQIWPFETGFQTLSPKQLQNTSCVLAEIYPSTVLVRPKPNEILDEAQVRTLSEHLESRDSAGDLAGAFGPPDSISDGEIHRITAEEGWILAK